MRAKGGTLGVMFAGRRVRLDGGGSALWRDQRSHDHALGPSPSVAGGWVRLLTSHRPGGSGVFSARNDLSSLPLFILAFMWVEFWNNVATAPYAALIPDIVPAEQRGSASGWYGLMNVLGSFVGGVAALIFTQNGVTDIASIYYFMAAIMFLGMLGTVMFVKEPPVTKAPPAFKWGVFSARSDQPVS